MLCHLAKAKEKRQMKIFHCQEINFASVTETFEQGKNFPHLFWPSLRWINMKKVSVSKRAAHHTLVSFLCVNFFLSASDYCTIIAVHIYELHCSILQCLTTLEKRVLQFLFRLVIASIWTEAKATINAHFFFDAAFFHPPVHKNKMKWNEMSDHKVNEHFTFFNRMQNREKIGIKKFVEKFH